MPHPKGPQQNHVHTILESRSWGRWEAEVPRQSGPEPWSKHPSYLFQACDVMYANGQIRWHTGTSLTFLGQTERRAARPRSSGRRPLEGDRAIFGRLKELLRDFKPSVNALLFKPKCLQHSWRSFFFCSFRKRRASDERKCRKPSDPGARSRRAPEPQSSFTGWYF